jgi:4-amino-4-deoxy-L-arabinose transferase-like glycosyltransferase
MFHTDIPLMVMSYIGSLKTLLYWPVFSWLGANVWTTRFPMILAGAATIFFFYRLAHRAAGPLAALIAVLLLATDPMFLMTNTFDWGPVALEHLLLVTGCFFLVRFAQESVARSGEPVRRILLPGPRPLEQGHLPLGVEWADGSGRGGVLA